MTFGDLPAINACLNGASALFLGAGYVLIRQGRWRAHRGFMLAAFVTSTLFLLCYLTYHGYLAYVLHRGPTRFLEPAWFRPIYLFVLLTHTLLAIVIVPMILVTLVRGLRERFDKHRRIARWTWPLWMYVSVTGVLIYFLLYQIFPQRPGPTVSEKSSSWIKFKGCVKELVVVGGVLSSWPAGLSALVRPGHTCAYQEEAIQGVNALFSN